MDALGLVCESHRSTEVLTSQEMDLIRHFLLPNLNSQSPGVRQQTVSLLKKVSHFPTLSLCLKCFLIIFETLSWKSTVTHWAGGSLHKGMELIGFWFSKGFAALTVVSHQRLFIPGINMHHGWSDHKWRAYSKFIHTWHNDVSLGDVSWGTTWDWTPLPHLICNKLPNNIVAKTLLL